MSEADAAEDFYKYRAAAQSALQLHLRIHPHENGRQFVVTDFTGKLFFESPELHRVQAFLEGRASFDKDADSNFWNAIEEAERDVIYRG